MFVSMFVFLLRFWCVRLCVWCVFGSGARGWGRRPGSAKHTRGESNAPAHEAADNRAGAGNGRKKHRTPPSPTALAASKVGTKHPHTHIHPTGHTTPSSSLLPLLRSPNPIRELFAGSQMALVSVCRHGQDQDNASGILNGHRDMPLTELGVSQAQEQAQRLKDSQASFDHILCSPLQRAHRTAEIIAEALAVKQVEVCPELIERDFGVLSGKPLTDIEKYASKLLRTPKVTYFLDAEGSESFEDCLTRAKLLLENVDAKYNGQHVLLVCHGDIAKMIAAVRRGLTWEQALTDMPYIANTDVVNLN